MSSKVRMLQIFTISFIAMVSLFCSLMFKLFLITETPEINMINLEWKIWMKLSKFPEAMK